MGRSVDGDAYSHWYVIFSSQSACFTKTLLQREAAARMVHTRFAQHPVCPRHSESQELGKTDEGSDWSPRSGFSSYCAFHRSRDSSFSRRSTVSAQLGSLDQGPPQTRLPNAPFRRTPGHPMMWPCFSRGGVRLGDSPPARERAHGVGMTIRVRVHTINRHVFSK